ncbi:MAG: DNA-binding protein [Ruminococcus sp.]|jgi:predicted DNA-binding protein with PD1-like motif|nr:DNA-binding protein [Ruminococcus sp.]
MEYKCFGADIAVRLDKGDELVEKLKEIAVKEDIPFASVSGIGAVGSAVTGYFDTAERRFKSSELTGDLEIVSLCGIINKMNGEAYLHLHMSIADESGKVYGGHLSKAVISGTGEIVLHCIDAETDRCFDEETGLNIIKF